MGPVFYEKIEIKYVIPTWKRANEITTHTLCPFASLAVSASEQSLYAKYGLDMIIIPDEYEGQGMGVLRNWLIKNIKEEIVFMLDDDATKLWVNVGRNGRAITDSEYAFVQKRNMNRGGNAVIRTNNMREEEIKRLKTKWGKYFLCREKKSGECTQIRVSRRQPQIKGA